MKEDSPNLDFLTQEALGNKAVVLKIIKVFKEEFPLDVKSYHDFLKAVNFIESAKCVHKFKHKISLLGLNNDLKLASMHEENLYKENSSLTAQFQLVLEKITCFLNTL